MGGSSGKLLSPTPHWAEIQGRAKEIARTHGERSGGPEHVFLGMLHDGGWPVHAISRLVDLARAEADTLRILDSPGYTPPAPAIIPWRDGDIYPWGVDVAIELGDSHLGAEHAFLAIIRTRDTIPARVLAEQADLDALEAAVLAARNAPNTVPGDAVFLPDGQHIGGLGKAILEALPPDTTFGFNVTEDQRTWVHVFGPGAANRPGLTREVLNTALASLNLPAL